MMIEGQASRPTRPRSSSSLNESWRRCARASRLVPHFVDDHPFRRIIGAQINAFYLEKEAELKLRLETLLSKRRTAAMRVLPDAMDDATKNHVEWSAVEEGFRLLERDIGKLQVDGRACVSSRSLYVSPASFLSSNSSRSTRWASGRSSKSGTNVRAPRPRSSTSRARSRSSQYSTDRFVSSYMHFCSAHHRIRVAYL